MGYTMQTLFPKHQLLLIGLFTIVISGCYAHAGKPYQAEQQEWLELADAACVRGDQRAHDALMTRAQVPEQARQCPPPAEN